jgi:hypothetical protein
MSGNYHPAGELFMMFTTKIEEEPDKTEIGGSDGPKYTTT